LCIFLCFVLFGCNIVYIVNVNSKLLMSAYRRVLPAAAATVFSTASSFTAAVVPAFAVMLSSLAAMACAAVIAFLTG
jgi:hypothetical protein